jgi:sulfopyruvate decarboxylase TPP-binding subunit
MDVTGRIHEQLTKCGIRIAASLPDDWVAPLIERIAADNQIRHVRVAREAEAIAICSGAFFGGVRSVALMGATGSSPAPASWPHSICVIRSPSS